MKIQIDTHKGRLAARKLYASFHNGGILGHKDMPEDTSPEGVERGSLDHLLFITFTVSIDYMRDAYRLWEASRDTFEDPKTRYLYQPAKVSQTPVEQVIHDMQVHKLSKKKTQDATTWQRIGITLDEKWGGDPRSFLKDCGWGTTTILKRLIKDSTFVDGKRVYDFPFLRGPKIGSLWLRMLRDNLGIDNITGFDLVPIPVDVHIERATFCLGVVRGQYKGSIIPILPYIRKAWTESVKGLWINGRPMIALDIDEPLWHLSKYGCTYRDKETGECPEKSRCEMEDYCIPGKISISSLGYLELDT